MIANQIAFGKSFSENILYNVQGNKKEPNPHKSEWYVSKNMFTDDLDAAGVMMQATASESKTPKPVYHFSIDWDRSEERFLTKEKCIEAADTILQKVGLEGHQALYFKHVDADHPHMHVVVNRVNPETGKAWDMWKSKERLERATHTVAKDMEFMQVPGRHNEMDFKPDLSKEAPSSRAEKSTEQDLKPWVKEKIPDIKAEIGNAFYNANSWEELSGQMSEAGYELRTKGQGLIITDGKNYTQLSKMGKHVRLNNLEEKFGEKFSEHQGKDPLEPAQENTTVESFDDLPERIERRLKEKVESFDNLPEAEFEDRDTPQTSDSRAIKLLTTLDAIDRFEGNWKVQKSAGNISYLEESIRRQNNYFEKVKKLADYHNEKGMELLLAFDKKFDKDKTVSVEDKLKSAIKEMSEKKTPKWKLIINGLKKRIKNLQTARKKRKENKKKWQRKREWQMYYRMQKIREAQSRITSKELELNQTKGKLKTSEKAHKQNKATRDYLLSSRQAQVKSLPKEAIMNANIPYKEKQRLFSAWFAEQERSKGKDKSRERDVTRDPFDD